MAGEGEKDPQMIEAENREALDTGPGDDALDQRQPGADPQPQPGADPQEPVKPVRTGPFDDKRARIAELARQQREERDDPELSEQIAETRENRFSRTVEQPALVDKPQDQQPPAPTPAAKRKLKVNGQELELTDEQVLAEAQKSLAAGDILEQAKQKRDEAQTVLEQLRAAKGTPASAEPAAQPARQPEKAATTLSDTDLADIIDKIQVGDAKEAQAALRKYGDAITEEALGRVITGLDDKIATQVGVVNEITERQRLTVKTLNDFAKDNPEFSKSQPLQAALAQQSADTMRDRMRAIGVKDETFDRLKTELKMGDIEVSAYAYRSLKDQGYDLPDHGAILTESADALRKSFGMPARQPAATPPPPANRNFDPQDRIERKRVISPQPRRAGTPPGAMDPQQRTREEAGKAAVAQMRAHRRGRA